MIRMTDISTLVKGDAFLSEAVKAMTSKAVEAVLRQLPIVDEQSYQFDIDSPFRGWSEGQLHWVPVGRDRGNAGRITPGGTSN